MSSIRGKLGLGLAAVVVSLGVWACTATRNADGSWTAEFAPDMTITALGLEDALDGLVTLFTACLSGTFPRACTPTEIDELEDAIDDVLDRKGGLRKPSHDEGATLRGTAAAWA